MIVLFTSNETGGVLQFVMQMVNTLTEMNYSVKAFIPKGAVVTVKKTQEDQVCFYKKKKTINRFDITLQELSDRILSFNPSVIWIFDDTIHSTEISLLIGNRAKQILTIHDGGETHSTNIKGAKQVARRLLEKIMKDKSLKKVDKILLLSENSKKTFIQHYPNYIEKIALINLGAHVPDALEIKPSDNLPNAYFLFFGRIDKYKGILRLIKAYKAYHGKLGLVIAGKGTLTDEEAIEIDRENRCVLINRYISDEEMIWLFRNAHALVLPYLDATQSGIIPIAYKFGKPVIVSNVQGLTQFVVDGSTGYICNTDEDYVKAFSKIEMRPLSYEQPGKDYYSSNLDWNRNIESLFQQFLN